MRNEITVTGKVITQFDLIYEYKNEKFFKFYGNIMLDLGVKEVKLFGGGIISSLRHLTAQAAVNNK